MRKHDGNIDITVPVDAYGTALEEATDALEAHDIPVAEYVVTMAGDMQVYTDENPYNPFETLESYLNNRLEIAIIPEEPVSDNYERRYGSRILFIPNGTQTYFHVETDPVPSIDQGDQDVAEWVTQIEAALTNAGWTAKQSENL